MASDSASTMASESASTMASSTGVTESAMNTLADWKRDFNEDEPATRGTLISHYHGWERHRLAAVLGWNHIMFLMKKKNKKESRRRKELRNEGYTLARHLQNIKMPSGREAMRHRCESLNCNYGAWCEAVVNLHTREEVLNLIKEDLQTGAYDYGSLYTARPIYPREIVENLWDYPTLDLSIPTANPEKHNLN